MITQHDDLPIDDAASSAEKFTDLTELWEGVRKLVVVPGLHPDPATIDEGNCAHAIPFDFVGPASVVVWKLSSGGQHRIHPLGKRLEVRRRRVPGVGPPIL